MYPRFFAFFLLVTASFSLLAQEEFEGIIQVVIEDELNGKKEMEISVKNPYVKLHFAGESKEDELTLISDASTGILWMLAERGEQPVALQFNAKDYQTYMMRFAD